MSQKKISKPRKPAAPLIPKGKMIRVRVRSEAISDLKFFTSSAKLKTFLRHCAKVQPKRGKDIDHKPKDYKPAMRVTFKGIGCCRE